MRSMGNMLVSDKMREIWFSEVLGPIDRSSVELFASELGMAPPHKEYSEPIIIHDHIIMGSK